MFGYLAEAGDTKQSAFMCCFLDPSSCAVAPEGASLGIIADVDELPIRSGSIDACLLAHLLDFSNDPHQILREVERVLTPDGWIIISGFNPYSLVGLGRLLPNLRRRLPWSARMFSPERVLDWLHLLGFEVVHLEGFRVFNRDSPQPIPFLERENRQALRLPVCINLYAGCKKTYDSANPYPRSCLAETTGNGGRHGQT